MAGHDILPLFRALPSSVRQQEPINRCPLAGIMTNWYVLIIETEKNGRLLGMRLRYSTTSSLPVCAKVIHNLVVVVYRIAIWTKSLSSHTMANQQRKTLTYSKEDKEQRKRARRRRRGNREQLDPFVAGNPPLTTTMDNPEIGLA